MKEILRCKTHKRPSFVKVFGITTLVLLMLISIAGAAPFAYITHQSGTVSVLDTVTNTVTATVPVESFPIGVAVIPDGSKVYVVNAEGDGSIQATPTVSVIDTATNTVTATIDLG